jgi:hypothetical protein
MKIEEFRIGNLVEVNDKIVIVDGIRNLNYLYIQDVENPVLLKCAKPVALTEDWLPKLGFEYYEPLNHYRIVINDIWYSVTLNYKGLDGFWFSFVNLNVDETQEMPMKKVGFVHKLQNLFLDISEVELEFYAQ